MNACRGTTKPGLSPPTDKFQCGSKVSQHERCVIVRLGSAEDDSEAFNFTCREVAGVLQEVSSGQRMWGRVFNVLDSPRFRKDRRAPSVWFASSLTSRTVVPNNGRYHPPAVLRLSSATQPSIDRMVPLILHERSVYFLMRSRCLRLTRGWMHAGHGVHVSVLLHCCLLTP